MPGDDHRIDREAHAFAGRKKKVLGIVIAAMAIVVGLLFAMALLSQRR